MNSCEHSESISYFPAILCVECDSPIDALLALCVPRDEAMNLLAAAWRNDEFECVVASVDGGRSVAVLRTPEGRWAACNAFLDHVCLTRHEAERQLKKLLKRGRRGYIGALVLAAGEKKPA
ncbi:hypothetical protein [Propionivibrio sp.]|uniref:hypothetical protein n=1 Tax=Propionivibrio sp. TaxID=2212460 RepID=UPI0026173A19|nr:hypothetical protein [Propionivibrio sp.]